MIGIPPENLIANAIITQAAKDYRTALKGDDIAGRDSDCVIAECEAFFRSEWFQVLTSFEGEVLIEKLRKEASERKITRKR